MKIAEGIWFDFSGSLFEREFQDLPGLRLLLRFNLKGRNRSDRSAACPVEVFIEREESMRLELAKCLTESLLDPIDVVKETSPVHVQLPAAEFPIGTQQKVVFEDLILPVI